MGDAFEQDPRDARCVRIVDYDYHREPHDGRVMLADVLAFCRARGINPAYAFIEYAGCGTHQVVLRWTAPPPEATDDPNRCPECAMLSAHMPWCTRPVAMPWEQPRLL